jgi:hypothetical protein
MAHLGGGVKRLFIIDSPFDKCRWLFMLYVFHFLLF